MLVGHYTIEFLAGGVAILIYNFPIGTILICNFPNGTILICNFSFGKPSGRCGASPA